MPDSVAESLCATSKYIGTTMVRPIEVPIASDADAVPIRITGLFKTASGRNGSSVVASRQPNSADSTMDSAIKPRIGADNHANCVPPQVSANRIGMHDA